MTRISLAAGLLLVVAGLALIGFVLLEDGVAGGSTPQALPGPIRQFTPTPALDTPTPLPTATVSKAEIARLKLPSIDVDASVVSLGLLDGGVMDSPQTPTDVGWYTFSARPGVTGNAVFAGHVDYVNYGAAVFWRLRELQPGDAVNVVLVDGTSFSYRVVSSELYDEDTAPVQEIVGPTDNQTVTLITCAGVFDRGALEYNKRLVVRAERSDLAQAQP